jgi:RecA/RadA recombinase
MPTVSAAQALQDLKWSHTRCISTGLDLLDAFLQNRESVSSDVEPLYGGVSRGKVTEVYGPPGIGKTALG